MICIVGFLLELCVVSMTHWMTENTISDTGVICVIIFFSLFYYLFLYTSPRYKNTRLLFFIGYVIRAALLCYDVFIAHLPFSGIDAVNFITNAQKYAQGKEYWTNNAVVLFGTLMKVFGESRFLIQFFIMLFSVCTDHIIFNILEAIGIDKKNTRRAVMFLMFLPSYAIFSVVFLRESLVAMLTALSLWLFVKWWKNANDIFFWLAVAAVFAASIFHSGMVGVAMGYVGVRMLYDPVKKVYRLTVSSVMAVILFAAVFVFLFTRYSSLIFGKMSNLENISSISTGEGSGGASYASIAGDSRTIPRFILFTPIRMLLFLSAPLPFQVRGITDILAMVFNAWFYVWTCLRLIVTLGKGKNKNRRLLIALTIIGLAVTFVFAWGSTNYGTNLRHRDKLIPIFVVLLSMTFKAHEEDEVEYLLSLLGVDG